MNLSLKLWDEMVFMGKKRKRKKRNNETDFKAIYNRGMQLFLEESKISPLCGLDRRNLQWPGIVGLLSKPKMPRFNILVDLKVISTNCETIFGFLNSLISRSNLKRLLKSFNYLDITPGNIILF